MKYIHDIYMNYKKDLGIIAIYPCLLCGQRFESRYYRLIRRTWLI